MTVIDYPKVIKETQKILFSKEKAQSKALLRDRIRFLRLLKSGQCTSQQQAGALIGFSHRNSQRLWKRYCEQGLVGLLTYCFGGKPCRLNQEQREQLKGYLKQDQIQFLHEAKDYIEERFGIGYSISGLCKLFKRMKVKKKTGRPSNYRKDEKGAKAFKKSLLPS